MKRFFNLVLLILLSCMLAVANGKFTVVIDAGHGGRDAGAVRGSIKEKDINLKVALKLGQLIEKNMKDVKVVFTRKTDVFVDLKRRANMANKAKANLFISIHTNSTEAKTTKVSGADTYILGLSRSTENMRVAQRENSVILLEDNYKQKYENFDPKSPESYIIFEFMTNKYMDQSLQFASVTQGFFKTQAKRSDRGVKQAGFLVLRETAAPSVLIELGFINNPNEARFLSTASGQQTMANAIYSGFKSYKKEFDKRQGSASVSAANTTDSGKADRITVIQEEAKVTGSSETASRKDDGKTTDKIPSDKTEYRVQIKTDSKKISLTSANFNGLSPIRVYRDGKVYKYTYGSTTDKAEAEKLLRKAKAKYKDAFIVEFRNGKRIK